MYVPIKVKKKFNALLQKYKYIFNKDSFIVNAVSNY